MIRLYFIIYDYLLQQRKSAENLKRPYFTEDDEDIFLDYERTNVPADPGYEPYDDSTDIFA